MRGGPGVLFFDLTADKNDGYVRFFVGGYQLFHPPPV